MIRSMVYICGMVFHVTSVRFIMILIYLHSYQLIKLLSPSSITCRLPHLPIYLPSSSYHHYLSIYLPSSSYHHYLSTSIYLHHHIITIYLHLSTFIIISSLSIYLPTFIIISSLSIYIYLPSSSYHHYLSIYLPSSSLYQVCWHSEIRTGYGRSVMVRKH